jgi:large subunit ribosomal protein L17e
MEANAQVKNLEVERLIITHVQVNKAQMRKRRTYRAHGRISPYKAMPCHVQIWAQIDGPAPVKKGNEGK